ncbi:MAG: 50S ribosomal protein L6 [Candidatus Aenigmarchaeota archaeon]|nr:50S ribosomal protein L6 [Candidatus Aenigmarchaeota archaeon]
MDIEIRLPEGVHARAEKAYLEIKGVRGEVKKAFRHPKLTLTVKDSLVVIGAREEEAERKKVKALVGTWQAHIGNMIKGAQEGWEAKLKIVYSHFPVRFSVEGNEVLIQNFLGEKKPRKAKIYGNTKVSVGKDEVTVTGTSKEEVGQTAANIELATRVTGRDRRVFQDGCYIVGKVGQPS